MNEIDLRRIDLNLLVTFDMLMTERNVTRAAARLARTQSAVSHALARLREQVGDPLLVKVGGRMTPSPYAERLIDEVRPILQAIQRVLVPSEPFDPATSTRTFRVAISDIAPSLFPRVMSRISREAPHAVVDWIAEGPHTLLAVAEEQVDIAFVASALPLPDGVVARDAGEIGWATFLRDAHHAIEKWSAAEWRRWPHLVVRIGNSLTSPVAAAPDAAARERRIAARVLNFGAVAPLLARTDLLATLPVIAMHESIERYGLAALPLPFRVEPMPHRFVWSARLDNDPAIRWIRGIALECFAEVVAGSVSPRPRRASPAASRRR